MPTPLSIFCRPWLGNPSGRTALLHPVLVWEAAPRGVQTDGADRETGPAESATVATVGGLQTRPTAGEPLVFEVRKSGQASNALAIGITIGRTPNNDICVPDEGVSRFHGYFLRDEKSDLWTVVDAGSKNGIIADGVKLEPNKPHYLDARETIVVGGVPLLFLVPETFFAWADEFMRVELPPSAEPREL